ncbi:MAG: hypothetical protein UDG84_02080 [Thomasclavelia sp.]|nr:hypothetical protein [Thomasclavelia sp.]
MGWLRCKVKDWLREEVFKEELEDFRFMKLQCMNASAHSDRALHEVDEMKLLYQSITNVGVDVDYNKHSWAVICIEGKSEYVKFVDLTGAEARDIKSFVNQFGKKKAVVDSPFGSGFRDYIKGYEMGR